MSEEQITKIGKEAIQYATEIFAYGAGNIIDDIKKSNSESLGRSDFARRLYKEAKDNSDKELDNLQLTTLRAACAILANGGNCHEYASVTFTYFMENTNNLEISLCKYRMNVVDNGDYHTVILVRNPNDKNGYVVDVWGQRHGVFPLSDNRFNELEIIHTAVSDNSIELKNKFMGEIKKLKSYQKMKRAEKKWKQGSGNINPYKSQEDLQDLDSGFVGARGKIAYPFSMT